MNKANLKQDEVICAKVSNWSYAVFLIIFGVPLIINLVALKKNTSLILAVFLLIFTILCLMVWLLSHKIKLFHDRIEYSNLFVKNKRIEFNQIKKFGMETGVNKFKDVFLPPIRFVLVSKRGGDSSPIVINVKLFKKEEIKFICNFIKNNQ